MNKTKKIRTNLWGGVLFLLLAALIWFLIPSQIPASQSSAVGNDSRLMPRLVAIVIMICSAGLIFQSLVLKKETIVEVNLPAEKNALYSVIVMIEFLICIFIFGFLIGSFIMIVTFLLLFREKKPIPYVLLCVLSAGIYLLFTLVFNVPLTGGVLFQ